MYCRKCKYHLRDLPEHRCPECRRPFDPHDPRSYLSGLKPWWRPDPRRWLYVWLLPILWTLCSWINFSYPGDEYAGWGFGSLAGVWVLFVIGGNTINNLLLPVLIAGAMTMSVAGWIMDRLRVPLIVWGTVLFIAAGTICTTELLSFPSIQRAISKNGSLQTYIFPSVNLGMYVAVLSMLAITGTYRLVKWRYGHQRPDPRA